MTEVTKGFDPASISIDRPFPLELELPIQWGDMDSLGHVNNVMFMRYMESGRIAYFEKVGLERTLDGVSVGPILARATCDFIAPLHYPDLIRVGVRVSATGRSSFTMSYRIVSTGTKRLAAKGEAIIVMYDYKGGRSMPLDQALRDRIAALEATAPLQA